MRAGELRERCTFEGPGLAADDIGGNVRTWVVEFALWGKFRPERGSEALQAGRLNESDAGVLTLRKSSDTDRITTDWRVTIDGVLYNVRSIIDPFRTGDRVELLIERGVAI